MMLRRHRRRVQFTIWQFVVVFAIVFGPIASLGAMQSLANDCTTSCPCDAEEVALPAADPCGDEHDEHQDAPASAPADDCNDGCEECDCERGIASAVATNSGVDSAASLPDPRPDLRSAATPQHDGPDIFIPPRR